MFASQDETREIGAIARAQQAFARLERARALNRQVYLDNLARHGAEYQRSPKRDQDARTTVARDR